MNFTLMGILIYMLIQLGIAGYLLKKITTEKDYLLAGRNLGFGLITFSVFATWFGAETCIGSAGAIFERGLSGGQTDPFGYTICLILMGLFFAAKLRAKNLTTLSDLYKTRFSRRIEVLSAIIMIPTSMLWAAAQMRGFGQVISASSSFNVPTGIAIAAFLTIAYTMLGGLLADVVTDFIQSIVLIGGLVILTVAIFTSHDQPLELFKSIDPSKLHFFDSETSFLPQIEGLLGAILGSVVAQELISRMLASRNTKIARNSCLMASVIYFSVGLIPITLGLLGPALMGKLDEPEQLLPLMAKKYLSPMLYILFAGALISAILSTVDSALLSVGALLSHNVILPQMRTPSEHKKVLLARIIIVIAGVISYFIAVHSKGIYELIEGASMFGSSGILVITLFALYSRFGNEQSALATLLVGTGSFVLSAYILELETPYLISLIAAFSTYVLTTLLFYMLSPKKKLVGDAGFGHSSPRLQRVGCDPTSATTR